MIRKNENKKVNICISLHLHSESFERSQEVGERKDPHRDGLRKLKPKRYTQKAENSDE
jgi:hypothetical protein